MITTLPIAISHMSNPIGHMTITTSHMTGVSISNNTIH